MKAFAALGLALAWFVAGPSAARAAAPIAVDAAACPVLRQSVLDEKLSLEVASKGRPAPRGDLSVRLECSASTVRIWLPSWAAPREIPAPDANDPEPERAIAIAIVEAASSGGGPAPAEQPPRSFIFRRGLALTLDGSFTPVPALGVGARGWLPTGKHVGVQLGAHLRRVHQTRDTGEAITATIPELEVAIACRPPMAFGVFGAEWRVFAAPALALLNGVPAQEAGQRSWTVTTGFGWGSYIQLGQSIIGMSWDLGFVWPGPIPALDTHQGGLGRQLLRISLWAGFEAGGG